MPNKEAERIYDWSVRYKGYYKYPKTDGDSCFIKHDDSSYITEYQFDTIVDIKTKLSCMWSENKYMEEVIKPVAVAVMKHKPTNMTTREKKDSLNDFIYIF